MIENQDTYILVDFILYTLTQRINYTQGTGSSYNVSFKLNFYYLLPIKTNLLITIHNTSIYIT